jgi:cytochrome o ubiquinol oxidase subunit 2
LIASLAGCDMVLLHPSGYVAAQQGQLIVISTLLMLLIIVPVIVLTLVFAWRYRARNTAAPYTPEWDHSIQLELLIWSAPLLIIIALGALTWIGTHTLDPYRPLTRIDATRPVPDKTKPLNIEVVALDWKWLFIYPDLDIAVVNELAAPVPIRFKITSLFAVINSGLRESNVCGLQWTWEVVAQMPGSSRHPRSRHIHRW